MNLKRTILKKWLMCTVFTLLVSNLTAQNVITLTVTDIDNASVTQKMEVNATALLSEFNKAYSENKTPSLNKMNGLSKDAKSAILSMWEMAPFKCNEPKITQSGLRMSSGWQVRNIKLFLKGMPQDEEEKEIVINFNREGAIDDIFFAIPYHNYVDVMSGESETDLRRRQAILNFVENFRTAYNRKDLGLLNKIFSDDALIITGKVVKQSQRADLGNYGFSRDKIEYQTLNKKEYISRLSAIFKSNTRINVVFDNLEISRHPKWDEIYGVTLRQGWNTTSYSDVGFLFLLIDFKDGENMQIHVRTWQPELLNGIQLLEDEVFGLGDFKIQQ